MRKGKFNARRSHYGGVIYASRMEADYAARLNMLRNAENRKERVEDWRRQRRFEMIVNGKKVCTYVADFEVDFADGRTEIHETKGVETPVWKIKRKLFEALYPDKVLKVIR